ncbi:MAG TPA: hypothetical protein VEV38_04535 [Candidatus Eremiobacteraceae bacterium]|nr:hypothetical protein [Candidatus Eremiobacteraceae bacterium]
MPLCQNCSQAYDDAAVVCPHCGATNAPPPKYTTGSRQGDEVIGSGLGCLAASLLIALDISLLSMTNPIFGGHPQGLFLGLQVVAMIGFIWLCVWALRRGVSPAMRAGLLTFTIITAVGLGLVGSCTAMFMGNSIN